ncbi:MAG: hypothetical protein ACI9NY_001416 [Kiritimatiellia bacterium]|jgi:hypothetical protein
MQNLLSSLTSLFNQIRKPQKRIAGSFFGRWLIEVWLIFWSLVKIMLPMLLLVRFIELLGWIEPMALLLEPVMMWVGLPGDMGLVWLSAMLSSVYTGMAIFYQIAGTEPMTIAQVSVLGTMILVAHGLPVEVAIARASGVSLWFTLLLRISAALGLGALLNMTYSNAQWLQAPAPLLWQATIHSSDWLSWLITQVHMLLAALGIIAGLTLLIHLLRYLGIEKLIHLMLAPVLRMLGIGAKATNIMLVGLTLGISFGGGILIQEARSGKIDAKDVFMTMALLSLCHGIIEDTLLILLLGADLSAVLWARLGFSLLVIVLLARLLDYLPLRWHCWLYNSVKR